MGHTIKTFAPTSGAVREEPAADETFALMRLPPTSSVSKCCPPIATALRRTLRRYAVWQAGAADTGIFGPDAEAEIVQPRLRSGQWERHAVDDESGSCRPHGQEVHARVAEKPASELAVRPVVEFGRRGALFDPAVAHQRDLVGERHCFRLIVGDINDRLPDVLSQLFEGPDQRKFRVRLDVGCRLVKQGNGSAARDGATHCDLLTRPEVKAIDVQPARVAQFEDVDRFLYPSAPLCRRDGAVVRKRQLNILGHVQRPVHDRILEDHRHIALARGKRRHIANAEADDARIRTLQPGDHSQQRRLPAT